MMTGRSSMLQDCKLPEREDKLGEVSVAEGSEEHMPGGQRSPAGRRAGGSGTYEYSRLTSGPVGAEPDPLLGAQLGPQAGGVQRTFRLGGLNPPLAQHPGLGLAGEGGHSRPPQPTQLLLMSPTRSSSCQSFSLQSPLTPKPSSEEEAGTK